MAIRFPKALSGLTGITNKIKNLVKFLKITENNFLYSMKEMNYNEK